MSYIVRLFVWILALFNAHMVFSNNGLRKGAWTLNILGTFKPWTRGPWTRGAGYINGWTFYMGRNCVKRDTVTYSPTFRKFVIGFTTNGNHTPWLEH